ncbi:hypothetical protein P3S68_011159 [Capsicum galapagoense]
MCQNGHNDKNSHLRVTLNNILGLEDSDSLLHNDNENDEKSYGGYVNGPDRHLDSNDEDLQNMVDEEMNRSHQSDEEECLSVSDCKEYDHQDHGTKEDEGTMHNDGYTDAQYTAGPIIARNQSKTEDCKVRVNFHLMSDGLCIVTMVILEHNHELDPTLSYFFPCHRKLRRTLKRSLVAHDIAV